MHQNRRGGDPTRRQALRFVRRTLATLAGQLGMSMGERQALMGHSRAAMTMAYMHTPTEQARAALEQFSEKVGRVS